MKISFYIFYIFCAICYCTAAIQWDKFIPKHGLPPLIGPKPRNDFIKSASIEVPLDHFNSNDNRTWMMNYYFNSQFFKNNGPIFIMLGGEWTITTDWVQYGQMYDIAQQTGAYMFYTQHRFYGDSFANAKNINLSVDNLKYLMADQALADVAYFVEGLKKSVQFQNSKIVVFGGSYAGTLSIWMRRKYPELIHAAVASSPPMVARANFVEYSYEVFKHLGPKCSSVIDNALVQILAHLGTPKGARQLQKDYNMCKPIDITNILDVLYIFSHITTHFANVVQYASCGSIESTCNKILAPKNVDDYTKLALYLNGTFHPDCLPNYQELREHLTDLTPDGRNTRQWFYQQCKEFGYFQTYRRMGHEIQPLEMYQNWCREFFDISFSPEMTELGVKRTNSFNGNVFLNTTRIISVHGTGDPWHLLGATNSSDAVILVDGSSHCQDLYPISGCDTPQLIEAKLSVQKYVKQWLKDV